MRASVQEVQPLNTRSPERKNQGDRRRIKRRKSPHPWGKSPTFQTNAQYKMKQNRKKGKKREKKEDLHQDTASWYFRNDRDKDRINLPERRCKQSFSSVQLLSRIWLFATPWTAAHQASLSITNFSSLLKLMPIVSVMPSNHLILCHPLLLPPSISPSIRVFPSESVLRIRWLKCYWEFQLQHQSFQWKGKQTLVLKKTEWWLRMVLDFRTAEASRQWGGTFKMEGKWLQIW